MPVVFCAPPVCVEMYPGFLFLPSSLFKYHVVIGCLQLVPGPFGPLGAHVLAVVVLPVADDAISDEGFTVGLVLIGKLHSLVHESVLLEALELDRGVELLQLLLVQNHAQKLLRAVAPKPPGSW
eukprot:maker-scaffold1292_size50302-snap-gene-0.8 protein:Tk05684 transcript:maker-scaffold1292_size50302-snap-gene-0.8-mRNA-1 annotation:"hypothetical protein"